MIINLFIALVQAVYQQLKQSKSSADYQSCVYDTINILHYVRRYIVILMYLLKSQIMHSLKMYMRYKIISLKYFQRLLHYIIMSDIP